jgi:hypothetical protein
MSRRNSIDRNGRAKNWLPPFVPMLKDTNKERAWIAMSHGARSLYMALKSRYNQRLGNAVYLSVRVAAAEIGSNKDYVARWFRELQYYGFIVQISAGCLGLDGKGKAPHWRLTEVHYHGEPPTRDFKNWSGEKFREQKSPKTLPTEKTESRPSKWGHAVP